MNLAYTTHRVPPDITVVRLTGRLTLGREAQTVEALVRQMVRENCRKLVLDLAGIETLDSAGLGCLAISAAVILRQDGRLVLAGAGGRARRVLELTHMDRVLSLYASAEAACQALSEGA